jgi:hypothetical protein
MAGRAGNKLAETSDGRAGARRVRTARAKKDFPPVQGNALPGEADELVWQPGRTWPVAEQEALGLLRRNERLDMIRRSGGEVDESQLSDELPGWDLAKEQIGVRLTKRLRILAYALAELEDSNFTELVEDALLERILGAPRDPKGVAARRQELLDMTLTPAKEARAEKARPAPASDADLRAQVDRLQAIIDRLIEANPALADGGH